MRPIAVPLMFWKDISLPFSKQCSHTKTCPTKHRLHSSKKANNDPILITKCNHMIVIAKFYLFYIVFSTNSSAIGLFHDDKKKEDECTKKNWEMKENLKLQFCTQETTDQINQIDA